MEKQESNLDGLHQDLAKRFGALSQLFGQLGSPRAVQELLDGLTSEDGVAFKQFVDRVDFPMLGKFFGCGSLSKGYSRLHLGWSQEIAGSATT